MKYKLPDQKTEETLKRVVLSETGHTVNKFEDAYAYGGAYRLPNGNFIPVMVTDICDWLYFNKKDKPTRNMDLAIHIADERASLYADKLYRDDTAWRLRGDIQEVVKSEKAGVVTLPYSDSTSFSIKRQKDDFVHVIKVTQPKTRKPNLMVKYSVKPADIDVEFYGCVEDIAEYIEKNS